MIPPGKRELNNHYYHQTFDIWRTLVGTVMHNVLLCFDLLWSQYEFKHIRTITKPTNKCQQSFLLCDCSTIKGYKSFTASEAYLLICYPCMQMGRHLHVDVISALLTIVHRIMYVGECQEIPRIRVIHYVSYYEWSATMIDCRNKVVIDHGTRCED